MDFTGIRPEPTGDILDEPELTDDMLREEFTEPKSEFLGKDKRKPYSVQYEKKVKGVLNGIMRGALSNPHTVPDAAAIIMYGPTISETMGDWAASDVRVRKAVDFITSGTDNPAIAAMFAFAPLILQVLRNHEPVAEVEPRRIRIPFTKKYIRLRFKVKLGKLRNMTNDPREFTQWVLSNPKIQEGLAKQGIQFATESSNGKK